MEEDEQSHFCRLFWSVVSLGNGRIILEIRSKKEGELKRLDANENVNVEPF